MPRRDLNAQLTGGDDDQRLRDAVAALGRGDDALQQRDAEAEGLAGAGARLADEVVAGERQGEGQLLDGEGSGDAHLGQGRDHVGVDVEVAEQRSVLGDGGAAELLGGLLELLGGGSPGLGVLEGGGGGVVGGGQCSRLWCAGGAGPGRMSRRTCPGRLSRDQFQRRHGQQTGRRIGPGDSPGGRRPAVVSAQIHERTERLAHSHRSVRCG
jgi:hypothetical protein